VLSADPRSGLSGGEGAAYLSEVREGHRVATNRPPRVEIQTPTREVALRLRLAANEQVVSRHQERLIDNTPWSLQTSFYPLRFATSGEAPRLLMADDITEGTVLYLEQTMGIKQVGYRDWITARGPDSNEQKFFKLSPDTTVFVIYRTAFDQTGTPIRVTVTVFPADRNQFIVNVGELPDPQYEEPASPPEIQV
jgi:GntR family transcriptional regulator